MLCLSVILKVFVYQLFLILMYSQNLSVSMVAVCLQMVLVLISDAVLILHGP